MAHHLQTEITLEHARKRSWPDVEPPAARRLGRLAPAGAPVGIAPLMRGCKAWIASHPRADGAISYFADYAGVRYARGTSSGRAALSIILKALQALRPGRRVVALPAYTCFSAAAAAVRAGLKLLPVEVDPQTLDYDYARLAAIPANELLCILTSNLFGFVNDVPRLRTIAEDKGAYLVDDAAQSLGASRDGNLSGTVSHVGFFSLGRGKPLPAGEGGIIVSNSPEIAEALDQQLSRTALSSWGDNAALAAKVLATSVFINRYLYWIPDSLPFLKLGTTPFEPGFPVKRIPRLSLGLLREMLGKLGDLNAARRQRAAWIVEAIGENSDFTYPSVPARCKPTYLRFPLLARNRELRDRAVRELRNAGMGASPYYPSAICEIPGIESHLITPECHCPQAESLAARLLTLPTHASVDKEDVGRMTRLLELQTAVHS